jgi:hypothetical protein
MLSQLYVLNDHQLSVDGLKFFRLRRLKDGGFRPPTNTLRMG